MAITFYERYQSLTTRQMVQLERRAAQQRVATGTREREFNSRIVWYGTKIKRDLSIGLATKVRLAGQLLRDRIVLNLSKPVTKLPQRRRRRSMNREGTIRKRGSRFTWVDPRSRSRPGGFPHLETGTLRRSIYHKFDKTRIAARVGTTLGYGIILETRKRRSFLRRTMRESLPAIKNAIVKHNPGDNLPKVFQ